MPVVYFLKLSPWLSRAHSCHGQGLKDSHTQIYTIPCNTYCLSSIILNHQDAQQCGLRTLAVASKPVQKHTRGLRLLRPLFSHVGGV